MLHVFDHFAAAVLAEVDIEVRHRDAFGIEEALEQQAEPDRVEVGNRQRIRHQRACARTTARTDRNAVGLGPFDEVRHDQEVTRVFHAGDDVELEREPLVVVLFGRPRRQAVNAEPFGKALLGLAAQLGRFGGGGFRRVADAGADGEQRQDRLAGQRPIGAALRDLHRRGQRLGQIGEQHRHLGAGLEAVVGSKLEPIGLGDQLAGGDTQQRVVRLVILGAGEMRLVGRDQRQTLVVSEIDQPAFGAALGLGAMTLQFDIQPIAERLLQPLAALRGERRIGQHRQRDRPVRPAGQRDHAVGFAGEPFELDVRHLIDRRLQERPGVQPHQAAIALLARCQQHDPRRRRQGAMARVRILVAEVDAEFEADDRLNAIARQLVGEFQTAEHVVGVGQGQRRLPVGLRQLGQLGDFHRAFQQRIGRVDVQMDESGVAHRRGGSSDKRAGWDEWFAEPVAVTATDSEAQWWAPSPFTASIGGDLIPAMPKRSQRCPRSGLRQHLSPHRHHADEQCNRRQRRSFLDEDLQHRPPP